jgi:hypothetical protein
MKMTFSDAYNLIVGTVERKLAETVKRWGYTVQKVGEGRRVCWILKELESWDIISVTERKPYIRHIRLWRPTNYVRRLCPQCWGEPEELLVKWVSSFVTPAIEATVVALAEKALRDVETVRGILLRLPAPDWRTLQLQFGAGKAIYFDFRLRKTVWSWKITSERQIPLATIRQPIAEHPVNTLLAVARNFGLLIL